MVQYVQICVHTDVYIGSFSSNKTYVSNTKPVLSNLAVLLDPSLNFEQHIKKIVQSCCFRVDFKILLLILALNRHGPSYLSEHLTPYKTAHSLSSGP